MKALLLFYSQLNDVCVAFDIQKILFPHSSTRFFQPRQLSEKKMPEFSSQLKWQYEKISARCANVCALDSEKKSSGNKCLFMQTGHHRIARDVLNIMMRSGEGHSQFSQTAFVIKTFRRKCEIFIFARGDHWCGTMLRRQWDIFLLSSSSCSFQNFRLLSHANDSKIGSLRCLVKIFKKNLASWACLRFNFWTSTFTSLTRSFTENCVTHNPDSTQRSRTQQKREGWILERQFKRHPLRLNSSFLFAISRVD